jgi:hypothetical protein
MISGRSPNVELVEAGVQDWSTQLSSAIYDPLIRALNEIKPGVLALFTPSYRINEIPVSIDR